MGNVSLVPTDKKLIYPFIGADIYSGLTWFSVNIFDDIRQYKPFVNGVDGPILQVQVTMCRINKAIRQIFDKIVDKCDFAFGFVAHSRTAEQVVGDQQTIICKNRS